MNVPSALEVLKERRKYLAARIAAKESVGWDVEWDKREWRALHIVITAVEGTEF